MDPIITTQKTRKPRTIKPKITTEDITQTTPPNIKTNAKDKTLKHTTEHFKLQKQKENYNIRQQLKDHAELTKKVNILNKSLTKLAKK